MVTPAFSTVPRLARRMREHQLEALTDQVFGLITTAMPDYTAATSLTDSELREANYRNVDHLLLALLGEEAGDARWTVLQATGQRRAQQRVPLESVLQSFRLAGRVLWEGLVRECTLTGDMDDLNRLLNDAVAVWEVIDRGSTVVARAYRDEQARVLRRTQRRRELVLADLLEGRALTPATTVEASDALGVTATTALLVVVSSSGRTGSDPVPVVEAALAAAGFPSAWVSRGVRDSGVIALHTPEDEDRAITVLGNSLSGPAVTSGVVHGVEMLAQAHRLATLALGTVPRGHRGLVRCVDRLPHSLLAGSPDVADVLAHHHLGDVLRLRPSEREKYLATIEALVRANGSYAAAARLLGCHRNTVIKRLRRLEALTGRSLNDLSAVFDLHLAVLTVRIQAEQQRARDAHLLAM